MIRSKNAKQAARRSLTLHGSLLLAAFLWMWVSGFKPKPDETVFELIPYSENPGTTSEEASSSPEPQESPPLEPLDFPDEIMDFSPPSVQAIDLPPRPEPTVEPDPPPPRPKPEPAPPKPEPQPQKADPAPAPKPMSFEEFQRLQGRKPAPPKPAPTTDFRNIRQSFSTNSNTSAGEAGQRTIEAWYQALRRALEASWIAPERVFGETILSLNISPNGAISRMKIVKSSGNQTFDESVLSAARSLGNFAPPPDGKPHTARIPFRKNL